MITNYILHDIAEILFKVALNTITLTLFIFLEGDECIIKI
jgi:hypothetical protein